MTETLFRLGLALLVLVTLLTGCSPASRHQSPRPPLTQPVSTSDFTYSVLRSDVLHTPFGDYGYQLVKILNLNGGFTYAQWFPPTGPDGAVVAYTQPYAGIDWSGDPLDEKWAGRPNALEGYSYPDEDGPGFGAGSTGIRYQLKTPNQIGEQSAAYLYNGVGVLQIFGRFYAGGSIENDVWDMYSGLLFLSQQPNVNFQKIGMYGASWGGFEALYGTAYAPNGVKPAATAILFPPIDFELMYAYITDFLQNPLNVTSETRRGEFFGLFEPYGRRIVSGVTSIGLAPFKAETVRPLLTNPVLIFHDEWDTLVPFAFSSSFLQGAPSHIEKFWFTHDRPVNFTTDAIAHNQTQEGLDETVTQMFSYAFLMTRILDASSPITTFFVQDKLVTFFNYMRARQLAGADISFLVPRLLELCDPRVTMYDYMPGTTLQPAPGAYYVSLVLNALWGTSLTAENVADYLRTNGLVSP